MDCKERGSRKGNMSKKTGRQHRKRGSNNCPQETNLLQSPRSGLQSNSPVKSFCPNLQLWEDLLHKRTLPAKQSFKFHPNDFKEDQTRQVTLITSQFN
jgi:hypothetical protein